MISSLTTTGSSGAATLSGGVLNIPNYVGGVAYTFSTGLTNTSGTITVNTSQNIATLSNLTTNGFIKTTGGAGTLTIDTNTYLTTTTASSTYQPIITLTTTGNSGSSTFITNTLNIPTYTLSGLGGQSVLSGTGVVVSTAGTISYLNYSSSNAGGYLVQRDSTGNASFNNINLTSTQTTASGQTITMTYGSSAIQQSIGSGSITYKLPDATYMTQGTQYAFNNDCTGTLTIQNWAGTTQICSSFRRICNINLY